MRDDTIHPSDQVLLLAADGEMPERRGAEIRAHLEACWQCRARMAQIEKTIVDLVGAYAAEAYELPPALGPRALLKARMAELAEGGQRARWRVLPLGLHGRNLAYACALVLLVVLGARMLYQQTISSESSAVVYAELLPDPQLTPGATRAVAIGDLCSMPHDEVVRSVPNSLGRQVLTEYGVPNTRASEYEVDYLITPGLGGTEDIRNLWPEPHNDTSWNSYAKDQLEERLHRMVCSGQLDLETAQRQIASNWIVAYKKYFGTDQPVAVPSKQASLDSPNTGL